MKDHEIREAMQALLAGNDHPMLHQYPMINPFSTVEFPAPGPSFKAEAEQIAASPDKVNLELLVLLYRAMYQPHFVLAAKDKNKRAATATYIPGGVWGGQGRSGPADASDCKVMVIGKLPGREEMRHGRCFVGPSGDKLHELASVYFSKDELAHWYVCNVVRHPHLGPDESSAPAVNWCKDGWWLVSAEIAMIRPTHIVALGAEALKYVYPDVKQSSAAGVVLEREFPLPDGSKWPCKVVAGVHPAAVLRTPEMEPRLSMAMKLLAESIKGQVKTREKNYHYIYTLEHLTKLRDYLKSLSNPLLALDAEWQGRFPTDTGAYLRTVQIAWGPTNAASIFLHHTDGRAVFVKESHVAADGEVMFTDDTASAVAVLKEILLPSGNWNPRISGHYFNADIPWFLSLGIDLRGQFVPALTVEGTRVHGGFDSALAAHAVYETDQFELEAQCAKHLGWERYDRKLNDWLDTYCEQNEIKRKSLLGYGPVPDDIIGEYGCDDASGTWNLVQVFNGRDGQPGLLDRDSYGLESRTAFWRSMRGVLGFGEMHLRGLPVDLDRAAPLIESYVNVRDELLVELRKRIAWPEFKPNSHQQCCELLFGERFNGKRDNDGNPIRIRPPGATSLGLTPYKTTGKRSKLWEDACERQSEDALTPATDKEALIALTDQNKDVVELLADVRKAQYVIQTILKPGEEDEETGDTVYKAGTLSYVLADGRIHARFYQTKETRRSSVAAPAMQNWGKSVESRYAKLFERHQSFLSGKYLYPVRSIVKAPPDWAFIDGDWSAAEMCMMAWCSGDRRMIEHMSRAALPEDHPDHYDPHADTAVDFYRLNCAPRKKAMEKAGYKDFRNSAKTVNFGYAYGQAEESLVRRARMDNIVMTREDALGLKETLERKFPDLPRFFAECRARATRDRWVRNWAGGNRRFPASRDRQVIGELERQAMNFCIQGGVADAQNEALWNLYWYRFENYDPSRWYDILLGVHDQIILGCPIACVPWVVDEVMPVCMSQRVPIWPTGPDGRSTNDPGAPYHLPLPRPDVCEYWGVPLDKEGCRRLGVPEQYAA